MEKIFSLTKVFIKEYYQNLPVFDTTKRRINKKSIFFWLLSLIFFGVTYVSYEIIRFLVSIGQKEIFINLYSPILLMVLAFEAILSCANIFFFSKETENVLHMPIKATEMLVAKFITLLCMLYFSEGIFALVPLTLYGMMSSSVFVYYIWEIFVILVYPIFIASFVGILTFILMRFSKFARNKEFFQVIVTILLMASIIVLELVITKNVFNIQTDEQALGQMINFKDKMQGSNKLFLIVNSTIRLLTNPADIKSLMSVAYILAICGIGLLVFLTIGNITYLKDLLKNTNSIEKIKNKKSVTNFDKKIIDRSLSLSYFTKEIKLLIRNPFFFMQCIFPVMMLLLSCIILVFRIYPAFIQIIQDDTIKQSIENITFNSEAVCLILIVLQVMFSISNISLTAISRDGKNASFIKYVPIELYKQFIYKNIPQFILNMLITIVILGLIWHLIPTINIIYMIMVFAISIVINLINCYLMLIVDLRRPNLDWITEEAVVKKSDNKLFQYALMIVNILILLYIATIFKQSNIIFALIVELIVYISIFIVIDRCVKKWQVKLFNKII